MTRRYSHLGPVCVPKGKPLSQETIVELWRANTLLGWGNIARHCGVVRATLYRAIEGGNVHMRTALAIERFAEQWKRGDDAFMASLGRRWSEKRRAAYERSRRAA